MDDEFKAHWVDLVRPLFPNGSDISHYMSGGDFHVAVIWKLANDPVRPNKPSKKIILVVPGDVADDYVNKSEEQRAADDQKLRAFVVGRLGQHDSNHANPKDVPPPEVQWIVGAQVLNS